MKALAIIIRWLKLGASVFLWTMLAILLIRGTASIIKTGRAQPATAVAAAAAETVHQAGYPDLAVQSVAAMFTREYFTFDTGNPDQHAKRLSPYLAANLDRHAGLQVGSMQRSQFVETAWPYAVKETAPGRFLVTVVATVRTVAPPMPTPQPGETPPPPPQPDVRNLAVAVPVSTTSQNSGRQYVVWDLPHAVPVPAVGAPPGDPYLGDDIRDEQVQALLEGFFKAFTAPGATSESLGYFFLDKKPVPPLGGSWAYQSLSYRLLKHPSGSLALVDVELRDTISQAIYKQRRTLLLAKDGDTWFIRQMEPDLQRKEG